MRFFEKLSEKNDKNLSTKNHKLRLPIAQADQTKMLKAYEKDMNESNYGQSKISRTTGAGAHLNCK